MMKNTGRYDARSFSEAEYQPGTNDEILKNLLNITTASEMEATETDKLIELTTNTILSLNQKKCFSAIDLCKMHHDWLKDIYSWAGRYRQVNISKSGFMFAAANLIPNLMNEFEKTVLAKYTPCIFDSKTEIVNALAITHVELVLIHPFREGNGRLARLLSTLMAFQAGLPSLNFSMIKNQQQEEYFAAIRKGLERNYEPMQTIFEKVIAKSI